MDKTFQNTQRELKIDRIRFLCMILIMMAHTIPSDAFMQIRAFDVVSLVFISSLCTKNIGCLKDYGVYLYKRLKKLLIPVWILITAVLLGTFLIDVVFAQSPTYSLKTAILSYLLIDGIGYVWIVRILLMLAAIMPVLQMVINRIKNSGVVYAIAFLMVVLTDLIYFFARDRHQFIMYLVEYFVIPMIGYSAVALIALRIKQDGIKKSMVATIASLLLFGCFFAIICFNQGDLNITIYKYPPRSVYLFYGLFMTGILYWLIPSKEICGNLSFIDKLIFFVSSKSFDVYFAHIILVKITQYLIKLGFEIPNSYGLAIINIFGSILMLWLIEKIKLVLKEKNCNRKN